MTASTTTSFVFEAHLDNNSSLFSKPLKVLTEKRKTNYIIHEINRPSVNRDNRKAAPRKLLVYKYINIGMSVEVTSLLISACVLQQQRT